MKKTLLIICIAAIAAGCKKQNVPPQGLTGKWTLLTTRGGINGAIDTLALENAHVIQFNADNSFQSYQLGTLVNQGTYQVVKNSINIGGQTFNGIFYNHNKTGLVFRLNADTLNIGIDYNNQIDSVWVHY